MTLARRSHRKVRTGCCSCKRRRIKCDEQRPTCKNCVQHRIPCSYLEISPGPPRSQREAHKLSSNDKESSHVTPEIEDRVGDDNLMMVRLMHYFTTYTCQTLSPKRELQDLWRRQVPELAFHHPYLLQMIFAITALHISRRDPSKASYLSYGYEQYEKSLKNSSLALSEISPDNCHALYAVSVLAFLFEFGTLHHRESLIYNHNGSLADWIVHSRGVHAIIGSSWHCLATGCLKQMLACEFTSRVPAQFELSLNGFISHAKSLTIPEHTLQAYIHATSELVRWSKLEGLGFYGWLCQFPGTYGELLERRDPFSLVIFGYASVLLKYGEPRYWVDGWAEKLLREIYGSLNTSLRVHLDWPMEELGGGTSLRIKSIA